MSWTTWNDSSTAGIRQGALWAYTQHEDIYRCPSDRTLWPYGSRRARRSFNVQLNLYLNGDDNYGLGGNPYWLILQKASQIRRPANRFAFLDSDEASMTCGASALPWDQARIWYMMPGDRDRGCGANVALADGHLIFKKWEYMGRVRTDTSTAVVNQQDDNDLAWLKSLLPRLGGP